MNALEKYASCHSPIAFMLGAAGIFLSVSWDMAVAHTPGGGHPTSSTLTCNTPVELGVGTTCTFEITDNQTGAQRTAPLGTATFSTAGVGGFSPANTCTLVQNVVTFTSSCSVTYTPTGVGPHTITGSYALTTQGGHSWAATSATASITIRPRVAKSFSPSSVEIAQTSTLTVTLSNYNTFAITGVAFTDNYPSGLVNASPLVAANGCGGALTAAAGGNSIALSGGTIPAASGGAPGACSITVSVTSASAGSYVNTIGAGTVSSTNAGTNGTPASSTLTVIVTVGAFDAFETSVAAGSTSGPIKTKIAGAGFSLDVVALDVTKTILQSGFSGDIRIDLVGNINTGVATDANGCPVTAGLNQVVSASLAMTGQRQTVAFAAVADAWRDVRVKISYPAALPTVISCSTDNFAVRPNSFTLGATDFNEDTAGTTRTLNNTSAAGGTVHKAGTPFTITAAAVNAAGTPATTTNYGGSPTSTLSACGGTACTASFGTFSLSGSFVSGVLSPDLATYTEVGAFALTLEDQTFADVDAADSTTAERYVTSATISVGRFVPDHFTLITAGASAPNVVNRAGVSGCYPTTTGSITAGTASLSVASATGFATGDKVVVFGAGAAGGDLSATITAVAGTTLTLSVAASVTVANTPVREDGFSYFGETMQTVFRLEARNASDAVTTLYAGALAALTPTAAAGYNFGAINGATTLTSRLGVTPAVGNTWSAGVLDATVTLVLNRGVTEDGPFDQLDIGIAPIDADDIQLASFDLDIDAPAGTNDHARLARTKARLGRLRLQNAFGSELLDLPVPIEAQYFSGGVYVTNSDDNCTTVIPGNLVLSPAATATLGGAFQAGKGSLKIAKPGSKVSIDLCVDLDFDAVIQNDASCVATTPGNKTYLQWKWTGSSFDKDPEARATFGVYKNADEFIYQRENF